MGIEQIRALKAAKTGSVMTAAEVQKLFKGPRPPIMRRCKECKKEFALTFPGGAKVFCSYQCVANHKKKTGNWGKSRKRFWKKCDECGKEFEKRPGYSLPKWNIIRYCSVKCAQEQNRIKDGTTRGERASRKLGCIPKGSKEYFEKMSRSTKEGMLKPEVKEKLRRPKGPMSEDQKASISNKLAGKLPSNLNSIYNGPYGNVQRGEYECSKGSVYFRSKWEANYALYLDFLVRAKEIVNWEFEPDVFFFDQIKLGTRSYRPDFKIFNTDGTIEYHEIKGHMNSSSRTKLKRMAKYHSSVKLVLIQKDKYAEIKRSMKGLIKFYK